MDSVCRKKSNTCQPMSDYRCLFLETNILSFFRHLSSVDLPWSCTQTRIAIFQVAPSPSITSSSVLSREINRRALNSIATDRIVYIMLSRFSNTSQPGNETFLSSLIQLFSHPSPEILGER